MMSRSGRPDPAGVLHDRRLTDAPRMVELPLVDPGGKAVQ